MKFLLLLFLLPIHGVFAKDQSIAEFYFRIRTVMISIDDQDPVTKALEDHAVFQLKATLFDDKTLRVELRPLYQTPEMELLSVEGKLSRLTFEHLRRRLVAMSFNIRPRKDNGLFPLPGRPESYLKLKIREKFDYDTETFHGNLIEIEGIKPPFATSFFSAEFRGMLKGLSLNAVRGKFEKYEREYFDLIKERIARGG